MKIRTAEQWKSILEAYREFDGSTIAFCREHNIAQQTMYNQLRKHRSLTAKARNQQLVKSQCLNNFVQAKLPMPSQTLVLLTEHAQLSLPSQCDPIWLATLLKGLAA